jgi:hypothetical protein
MANENGERVKQFLITPEVVKFISEQKCDYRLCTSCGGPILLPVTIKKPKPSDIKIQVGGHTLYVSAIQAKYIDVIDDTMLMTYLY